MKKNYRPILIVVVVIAIITAIFAYAYYAGKNGPQVFIDNDNQSLTFNKMDAQAALAKIFAAKHNRQVTDTNVTVVNVHNNFASGNISFGPKPGEGGGFLARLIDDVWIVDYEGNGSIDCQKIIALGYLQDVLTGFCDTPVAPVACTAEAKLCPDGSAVGRSGPNCEFSPCPGATGANLSASCQDQKGTWLAQYNECEYISKAWCDQVGGTFNECASACRHDAKAEVCTLQCVTVCSLK